MIKHLQLLELYLGNAYDLEKARPHMRQLWFRFLIVAEIGIALTFTPAAFIASSFCLLWVIVVSVHLIPRWRECGYKVRKYFLPLLPMIVATAAIMPFLSPYVEQMWDNFTVVSRRPILLIIPIVFILLTYSLHNSEKYDTPKITVGKYICGAVTAAYFLAFALDTPLRDFLVRTLT